MTDNALALAQNTMTLEGWDQSRAYLKKFIDNSMKINTDYGVIPGTQKKSLYKSGAEKLAKIYGLRPKYELLKEVEDFDKGFFYYKYKCEVIHIATGMVVGDAERSCNTKERKYLRQTPIDVLNTVQAMAQKRAVVAAIQMATGASEIFEEQVREQVVCEDPEPPPKSARNLLVARFFAVASERGFDPTIIKEALKKKKGVGSLTDLPDKDIDDAIDTLTMEYEAVGRGGTPKAIKAKTTAKPVEKPKVEEAEIVEPATIEDLEEIVGTLPATDNCRECGGKIKKKRDCKSENFCSAACQDKYYPTPKKREQGKLKEFIEKNKKTDKPKKKGKNVKKK